MSIGMCATLLPAVIVLVLLPASVFADPGQQGQTGVQATSSDADVELRGEHYLYGRGVPQNCKLAEASLRTAASHGNSRGQSVLGTMYLTGRCVGRDRPMAYRWFARALVRDPQNTRVSAYMKELWAQMSPQERQLSVTADAAAEQQSKDTQPPVMPQAQQPNQNTETVGVSNTQTRLNANTPDVRFTTSETRSLTDLEYSNLQSGLKWIPQSVRLVRGSEASAALVDGAGNRLADVAMKWIRTVRLPNGVKVLANGASTQSYGRPKAFFEISLNNRSTCMLSPKASLAVPGSAIDADAVNEIVWTSWMTLHDPSPGNSNTFESNSSLNNDFSSLILRMRDPSSTLSQCRTAGAETHSSTIEDSAADSSRCGAKDSSQETLLRLWDLVWGPVASVEKFLRTTCADPAAIAPLDQLPNSRFNAPISVTFGYVLLSSQTLADVPDAEKVRLLLKYGGAPREVYAYNTYDHTSFVDYIRGVKDALRCQDYRTQSIRVQCNHNMEVWDEIEAMALRSQ